MTYLDPTRVDRLFVYPNRREIVLSLELAPQWFGDDLPDLEASLRAKLAFYVAFLRDGRVERYHPEARGFTPWVEIAYETTLLSAVLEVVTRLQEEVIAQGIDVKLVSVERL